jgi:hypothetical protein
MTFNGERSGKSPVIAYGLQSPKRPMIESGILPPQAGLKTVAVLAEVMHQAGEMGLVSPRGRGGMVAREAGDRYQMIAEAVPNACVVAAVGEVVSFFHAGSFEVPGLPADGTGTCVSGPTSENAPLLGDKLNSGVAHSVSPPQKNRVNRRLSAKSIGDECSERYS